MFDRGKTAKRSSHTAARKLTQLPNAETGIPQQLFSESQIENLTTAALNVRSADIR